MWLAGWRRPQNSPQEDSFKYLFRLLELMYFDTEYVYTCPFLYPCGESYVHPAFHLVFNTTSNTSLSTMLTISISSFHNLGQKDDVNDLFKLTTALNYTCVTCAPLQGYMYYGQLLGNGPRVYRTREKLFFLTLPFHETPRSSTLNAYLDSYFATKRAHSRCPRCNQWHQRNRFTTIVEAPQILLIKIPRFNILHGGRLVKSQKAIRFGTELNLTDRLDEQQRRNPNRYPPVRYRLCAVVSHTGTNNRGHYTSLLRVPSNKRASTWNEVDGMVSRPVRLDTWLNRQSPRRNRPRRPKATPYYLCYFRTRNFR